MSMGQRIDVCNGDADGLCAVLQWRLADPQPARLVTGLKRDIAPVPYTHLTLPTNRAVEITCGRRIRKKRREKS